MCLAGIVAYWQDTADTVVENIVAWLSDITAACKLDIVVHKVFEHYEALSIPIAIAVHYWILLV